MKLNYRIKCRLRFQFIVYVWNERTFIISKTVLKTISIKMKYSKADESTICHILYLMLLRSLGIYRSDGRAPTVKSMQDFCGVEIFLLKKGKMETDKSANLIFINFAILQLRLSLLLKCNDDQGHKYVDKEKWKHYEVNDVENGHFNAKMLYGSLIFICGIHWMLKHPVDEKWCLDWLICSYGSQYIADLLGPSFTCLNCK